MPWWNLYIVVFMVAMVLSLMLTPVCQSLAFKTNFLDRPRNQDHKNHELATPLLGGVAICVSWLATILIGIMAVKVGDWERLPVIVTRSFPGILSVSSEIMVICVGAVLAMLLGLYDDRFNMSAKAKLGGQIAIAALVVTWGGVRISLFIQHEAFTWFASVLWMLIVFNAVNFFDNMDGLAVGTAAIALSLFTITAAINQQYFVSSLCAATAGATVGFWFYNHSPATIFMGDSGSHFLGYILGVTGAVVTYYNPEISTTRFPILIPMFILAIPLFDTAAITVIRYQMGKPIYIGDNNHISHRFVKMGLSRKQSVFVVHLLTLIVGLSVLPLLWGDGGAAVVSLVQACAILVFISVLQYGGMKSDSSEEASGP